MSSGGPSRWFPEPYGGQGVVGGHPWPDGSDTICPIDSEGLPVLPWAETSPPCPPTPQIIAEVSCPNAHKAGRVESGLYCPITVMSWKQKLKILKERPIFYC